MESLIPQIITILVVGAGTFATESVKESAKSMIQWLKEKINKTTGNENSDLFTQKALTHDEIALINDLASNNQDLRDDIIKNMQSVIKLLSEKEKNQVDTYIKNNYGNIQTFYYNYYPEKKSDNPEQLKNEIIERVGDIKKMVEDSTIENDEENIQDFNIDFDDLVEAIVEEKCVLFLGPEISTDQNGHSLHDNFNRSLHEKFEFNSEDGFFISNKVNKINSKASDYYCNRFKKDNERGLKLLKSVSQIPFHLIISLCPDNTLDLQYTKSHIENNFEWYDSTEKKVEHEISWLNPFLYNALGCITKKTKEYQGKYIFTHKEFDKYLKLEDSKRVPDRISRMVENDSSQIILLGFDFNKWYYRLLLFSFFNSSNKESSDRFSFDECSKTRKMNASFIQNQFGISLICNNSYQNFIDILWNKVRTSGLFKKKMITELDRLLDEINRSEQIEEIEKLKIKAEHIENRIKLI